MSWLKKIWKDPVWSSVIASAFVSVCAILLDKYSTLDFLDKIPSWGWIIILIVFICFILYGIYRKITNFEYNEYNFLKEKEIFEVIINGLLPSSSIDFMRDQNFRSSFRYEYIKVFFDFRDKKKNPKYAFINPRLEKTKTKLFDNIISLVDIVTQYSVSNSNNVVLLYDSIRNNNEKMKELHTYADNICKYYDKLVKDGHRLGL